MRFFDEDNKQFEWTLTVALLSCVIYVGSFCIIRLAQSSDDCNLRVVDFPVGRIRQFYRPLITSDKFLNRNVFYPNELTDVPSFHTDYFCGE